MRNTPWRALPHLAGFLLPPHVARCVYEGGWWTVLPVATVFIAVPIVDALGGMADDESRPSPEIERLEVINYIEHYGLTRREIAPGEYERIAPQHSWDSPFRVSNWMLINLARHSDHHCAASKRYQSLQLPIPAPRLPAGYGAMLLLALVPPLWFRVMNPRVVAADAHGVH